MVEVLAMSNVNQEENEKTTERETLSRTERIIKTHNQNGKSTRNE